MNPVNKGLLKGLRRVLEQQRKSFGRYFHFCRQSRAWSSTVSFSDLDEKDDMENDNYTDSKRELEPQGVDPKKGWGFRGVHRAIICGKVGQRVVGPADLPKPAQWHRIVVHNEFLGAYAVQKLVKNAAVYVEGDIETRVYNDGIDGQVRSIPEICVRRDGMLIQHSEGRFMAIWFLISNVS
ncbi:hypothetical protein PR202_gb01756 [Eleusine coracana subsp. coracana]|uniref:Single-stranded DNA-binding protein, mitochondrial n=1 Tax=Eleusine coracana subsp. coracana TaxID=191504 RepID=A0AAV5DWG0_ELECO|nr:hypothetical protein PR202_gb01756 [Eleusine coracana subsp. coracana]